MRVHDCAFVFRTYGQINYQRGLLGSEMAYLLTVFIRNWFFNHISVTIFPQKNLCGYLIDTPPLQDFVIQPRFRVSITDLLLCFGFCFHFAWFLLFGPIQLTPTKCRNWPDSPPSAPPSPTPSISPPPSIGRGGSWLYMLYSSIQASSLSSFFLIKFSIHTGIHTATHTHSISNIYVGT